MATDALTDVAEELYALLPDEFTAARNTRAKQVKTDDRELGERIAELRKPSPAAWILNQLVREHGDALDDLLDLGTKLREGQATGDGKALTTIGSERRKLVSSLLKQASELADAVERAPSRAVLDEVEQTLIAATVDASAGEAIGTGRLVRSLQAVGFEDVDLDGAVAGEASAAPPRKRRAGGESRGAKSQPATDGAKRGGAASRGAGAEQARADRDEARRAERDSASREARARSEADLKEARGRAEDAARALDEAQDLLHAAEWNADELRDERHDLETRLKELRTEIAEAERDEREAERVRAKAATAGDRARDDIEAAEAALERLGD